MSTPTPDDAQAMREALQRDAARVPEPAFDAALHYATVRRLRDLEHPARSRFGLVPALATAMAVVTLTALVVFWWPHPSPRIARHELAGSAAVPAANPRASLLAYQGAVNEGEATLFAMLDRDASSLLPPTAPVFDGVQP